MVPDPDTTNITKLCRYFLSDRYWCYSGIAIFHDHLGQVIYNIPWSANFYYLGEHILCHQYHLVQRVVYDINFGLHLKKSVLLQKNKQ